MSEVTTPRGRGRPPKGSGANSRQRLLEAALEDFASFGFDGASLRRIARKAGCDMAMVAHHFGTKEEFWSAAVEYAFARLSEVVDRFRAALLDPAAPLEQRLRRAVGQIFEEVVAEPALTRIVADEMGRNSARHALLMKTVIRPWVELYRPLWEAAIAAGMTRVSDPLILHFTIFGAATMLLTSRLTLSELSGTPWEPAQIRDEFCEAALQQLAMKQGRPPAAEPRG